MQKQTILDLIRFHVENNVQGFCTAAYAVAEECRTAGDEPFAREIEAQLACTPQKLHAVPLSATFTRLPGDTFPLILPKPIQRDLLRLAKSVERRTSAHRFLFLGPMGSGKTAAVQMLGSRTNRAVYAIDLTDMLGDTALETSDNITRTFTTVTTGSLIVVSGLTSLTANRKNSRPAAAFRKVLNQLPPLTVLVVTADLSAAEIEEWTPYFDAVLDFDRYTEADRLKAADAILTHQRSLLQRSGDAHPKLLHRLLQLNGASPFPGTVKMLLRSSLTLSDPDKPTDYLRHLFETLTKTHPLSLQDLRNKGYSVRDIEVLTGTPKSTVARLTQTTSHSGTPPAADVPQRTTDNAVSVLHHQGYSGSVEIDLESDKLCGKVLNIQCPIVYEADTVSELRRNFQIAVDDYLMSCKVDETKPRERTP